MGQLWPLRDRKWERANKFLSCPLHKPACPPLPGSALRGAMTHSLEIPSMAQQPATKVLKKLWWLGNIPLCICSLSFSASPFFPPHANYKWSISTYSRAPLFQSIFRLDEMRGKQENMSRGHIVMTVEFKVNKNMRVMGKLAGTMNWNWQWGWRLQEMG